jgi:hypothetical protein
VGRDTTPKHMAAPADMARSVLQAQSGGLGHATQRR